MGVNLNDSLGVTKGMGKPDIINELYEQLVDVGDKEITTAVVIFFNHDNKKVATSRVSINHNEKEQITPVDVFPYLLFRDFWEMTRNDS